MDAVPERRIRIAHLKVAPQERTAPVHDRLAGHPLVIAVLAALQRPLDIPYAGWLWGTIAAGFSAAGHDVFTPIWLLAGAATLGDLVWGARAAAHQGRYSPERKRSGRDAKIITLTLLLGLRMAEWWAKTWHLVDVAALLRTVGLSGISSSPAVASGGIISALVCAAVCFDEARSWDHHRRSLGGGRIPMLSALLALGSGVEARLTAAVNAPRTVKPGRRRTDAVVPPPSEP